MNYIQAGNGSSRVQAFSGESCIVLRDTLTTTQLNAAWAPSTTEFQMAADGFRMPAQGGQLMRSRSPDSSLHRSALARVSRRALVLKPVREVGR